MTALAHIAIVLLHLLDMRNMVILLCQQESPSSIYWFLGSSFGLTYSIFQGPMP